MNGIAKVNVQPQLKMLKPSKLSFKGDKDDTIDKVVDTASEVLDKVTKEPDEKTIKSGLAAVITVVSLFIAKQAPKIKAFIDKGKASNNKFLRAVAVTASVIISFLSVLGASKLFEDKVSKPKKPDDTPNTDSQNNKSPEDKVSSPEDVAKE